jgi:amino acid adenylation domain-containing protein
MTQSQHPTGNLSPEEKRRLLAELLSKRASEAKRAPEPQPLEAIDPGAPFPLNEIQQVFWVGRSSAVQLGNIGIHGYLEIECRDLDVSRAARAFTKLVRRHEMLRVVVLPDGTQRVRAEVPEFVIPVQDLSMLSVADRDARLLATREELSHQMFDVAQGSLIDIRAKRLDARTTLLFFSIDLIAVDTHSVVTIFREWAAYYSDPQRDAAPPLYSFREYARYEAELTSRKSADYQRAEAYWTKRIPHLPEAPQLPLRVDPSTIREPRFVRHADVLDAEQWSRLKERGRQHGLTPSILFGAVYVEVLARWSKSRHFTLNVIPSVRQPVHPEINQVVGPFSSINLLEVDLREPKSFLETARALQERLYEDLDHMQYNGIKVLRKLAQRRSSGLEALMPVVYTSTMLELKVLEGLGDIRYMITQTPQVWIDCQLAEREGALLFNWDVVEELFPEGMIATMFGALSARLRALCASESLFEERDFELLPENERTARAQANDTEGAHRALLLQAPCFAAARDTPERDAIIAHDRRLTYGELARESQALAVRLRRAGARPNALIAVSFAKGWEQIVAVMGVLEAGAAYLPLDPALPAARRELLLKHADCSIVVSTEPFVSDLAPELRAKLVTLDRLDEESLNDFSPAATGADDLAYVIFTSGSTGMPKGVMITHRAALNTIDDINERFAVCARDRVLALSSLSFDLSVYDLFGVLAAGGAVVLPRPGTERDPAHWLDLMERERVSLWNSVPALMRLLVEVADGRRELPVLRLVMMSGDWIPITLPQAIQRVAPAARVVSLGGATEGSIWSIYHDIERVAPEWTSIPYGKPLRNQRFYVRDAQHRDCPTWVPGELYIGGLGVAAGYLGDAERTNASFSQCLHSGERLYRTGDLGRYLPDGTIEFLGREDAQVKVAGHRIELEEIESHLARHDAVRAAVVRAVGDRHDKRLVAYVELEPNGHELERNALRDYLAERLPGYMVPRQLMFVPAIPLSANGKVDSKALPTPSLSSDEEEDTPVASESLSAARAELERVVLEVWEQVLGRTPIATNANFFELGGDSLLMLRVQRALAERIGREVPVVDLYARPKPSSLALYLAEQSNSDAGSAPRPNTRAGSTRAARRLRALRPEASADE